MRVLLVAATESEIAPLVAAFPCPLSHGARTSSFARGGQLIDVLITGVGMVATAAWCSRALIEARYDVAFNLGVCGTFDAAIPLGTTVHIVADRLAEIGAEDGDRFLTVQELALLKDDDFPFTGGRLVNREPPQNQALGTLLAVEGITVNTAHGDERSIAAVAARFAPQVESMEGAAFMYACLINDVAFAQVRAVANRVERRDRGAWKLTEAIESLCRTALSLLDGQ